MQPFVLIMIHNKAGQQRTLNTMADAFTDVVVGRMLCFYVQCQWRGRLVRIGSNTIRA